MRCHTNLELVMGLGIQKLKTQKGKPEVFGIQRNATQICTKPDFCYPNPSTKEGLLSLGICIGYTAIQAMSLVDLSKYITCYLRQYS